MYKTASEQVATEKNTQIHTVSWKSMKKKKRKEELKQLALKCKIENKNHLNHVS